MKYYTILCSGGVTGVMGKQLLPGSSYAENEFAKGVVESLLLSGHLEETKQEATVKTEKKITTDNTIV